MGRPRKDGTPAAKAGTGAKRGPKPKAETPKAHAATSSDVSRQITERKLKSLLRAATKTGEDMHELSGTLGNQIAQAVEHDHLHKKAFSVVRMLDRMSPEKLAEFFDSFDYYRDISGLQKKAESAPNFLGSAHQAEEETEEEESDDQKEQSATVHRFGERRGEATA